MNNRLGKHAYSYATFSHLFNWFWLRYEHAMLLIYESAKA